MNDTKQRYHSNKQEFLALKWAVTEQFHEYLYLMGKIGTNCSPDGQQPAHLYLFLDDLDAAGQRWVAQLASYNFSLEYQKEKIILWPTF